MTRTATIIIAVIVVVLLAAGAWLYMQPAAPMATDTTDTTSVTTATGDQPSGKISADTASAISSLVANFGGKLKNVSLTASTSTIATSMDTNYAAFVSPELLAQWKANPSIALGRHTSSPSPVRIDVTTITPTGDNNFTVVGQVVETTSADTASSTPNTYPVTITVSQQNGAWVITGAMRN